MEKRLMIANEVMVSPERAGEIVGKEMARDIERHLFEHPEEYFYITSQSASWCARTNEKQLCLFASEPTVFPSSFFGGFSGFGKSDILRDFLTSARPVVTPPETPFDHIFSAADALIDGGKRLLGLVEETYLHAIERHNGNGNYPSGFRMTVEGTF